MTLGNKQANEGAVQFDLFCAGGSCWLIVQCIFPGEFTVWLNAAHRCFLGVWDKRNLISPPPPLSMALKWTCSVEDKDLPISPPMRASLLCRPSVPAFLATLTVNSLLVFVVCRQEVGISRLTFWKCHKEAEIHSHPLCTSVKISKLARDMRVLQFSLFKHLKYSVGSGSLLAALFGLPHYLETLLRFS